jgi:TonB family protein
LLGVLLCVAAQLLEPAEPHYPEEAQKAGTTGVVVLQFEITAAGAVATVKAVRVDPPGHGFEEAALAAARRFRFAPASGPQEFTYEMRFGFGEQIDVQGHYLNRVGTTESASSGSFTRQLIEDRPLLRPGEIEELVPGLIVTQHSGAGKANQFLLRGFNLDHGTDFATTLDGVPINLPAHAHGQGYDDLNFIIPELIGHGDYFKGPYFASKGDFSSAGAADLTYVDSLPQTRIEAIGGTYGYWRFFGAASPDVFSGKLLVAVEAMHDDGPWVTPDDFRKYNGVLKYTLNIGEGTLSVLAQGYSGEWNATDQIPERAVPTIGRFGAIDDSDGGKSHRYTLSVNWDQPLAGGEFKAVLFGSRYDLDLFSDFTYFLADPVNGDQQEQYERRFYGGGGASWQWSGQSLRSEVGVEGRVDHVDPLGLFHTVRRERIHTWSLDDVTQRSGAIFGVAEAKLTSWLRVSAGLRATAYGFHVESNEPRNSGSAIAGLLLPKASAIFGPWAQTEIFVDFGEDYHSNDARGVTATIDARTGAPVTPVSPLPRSIGEEIGVRSEILPHVQLSLALWRLDLDSEFVWDADAGTTVPSAPTRREGLELSGRWRPMPWLLFDLDVALSRARFGSFDPAGQYVPEAIESAISAGATLQKLGPWSASLFFRYFGPRALTQDDSVRSDASALFNAQVSYRFLPEVQLTADVFNLFDAAAQDMAYSYTSRLPGEPAAGVNDVHLHPAEPRGARVALVLRL